MTMKTKDVFISCTTDDLKEFRRDTYRIIEDLNEQYMGRYQLVPKSMSTLPMSGKRRLPNDVSQSWAADANWMVLIVAWRYGHIQKGQELSVTQREYEAFRDAGGPNRNCFVYLAGDETDTPRYAKSAEEEHDLSEWKAKLSDADCTKLDAFKQDLRSAECRLFSDLPNFREQLERDLRAAIESELNQFDPIGVQQSLAAQQVIFSVEADIRHCISEVVILSNLKKVHDKLHQIRQFGIRRWREEVGMLWREGDLDREAEAVFWKGKAAIDKQLGGLMVLNQNVQEANVAEDVAKTLAVALQVDTLKDRRTFESIAYALARNVEAALTSANRAMRDRADALRHNYERLEQQLRDRGRSLVGEDAAWLSTEIAELKSRHEDLQAIVRRHDDWQRMHDTLETIDHTMGSAIFADDLDWWLRDSRSLERLLDEIGGSREAGGAGEGGEWEARVRRVRGHLEELASKKDEPTYMAMRKGFDQLFFDVDDRTLRSMTLSEQHVRAFDEELQRAKNAQHGKTVMYARH